MIPVQFTNNRFALQQPSPPSWQVPAMPSHLTTNWNWQPIAVGDIPPQIPQRSFQANSFSTMPTSSLIHLPFNRIVSTPAVEEVNRLFNASNAPFQRAAASHLPSPPFHSSLPLSSLASSSLPPPIQRTVTLPPAAIHSSLPTLSSNRSSTELNPTDLVVINGPSREEINCLFNAARAPFQQTVVSHLPSPPTHSSLPSAPIHQFHPAMNLNRASTGPNPISGSLNGLSFNSHFPSQYSHSNVPSLSPPNSVLFDPLPSSNLTNVSQPPIAQEECNQPITGNNGDHRSLHQPQTLSSSNSEIDLFIPNVTENLDLGPIQSLGVGRIANMGDDAIAPTAGAFASSRNQIFNHVGYRSAPDLSLVGTAHLSLSPRDWPQEESGASSIVNNTNIVGPDLGEIACEKVMKRHIESNSTKPATRIIIAKLIQEMFFLQYNIDHIYESFYADKKEGHVKKIALKVKSKTASPSEVFLIKVFKMHHALKCRLSKAQTTQILNKPALTFYCKSALKKTMPEADDKRIEKFIEKFMMLFYQDYIATPARVPDLNLVGTSVQESLIQQDTAHLSLSPREWPQAAIQPNVVSSSSTSSQSEATRAANNSHIVEIDLSEVACEEVFERYKKSKIKNSYRQLIVTTLICKKFYSEIQIIDDIYESIYKPQNQKETVEKILSKAKDADKTVILTLIKILHSLRHRLGENQRKGLLSKPALFIYCKEALKKAIPPTDKKKIEKFVEKFMMPFYQSYLANLTESDTENLDLGPSQIFSHVGDNSISSSEPLSNNLNLSNVIHDERLDLLNLYQTERESKIHKYLVCTCLIFKTFYPQSKIDRINDLIIQKQEDREMSLKKLINTIKSENASRDESHFAKGFEKIRTMERYLTEEIRSDQDKLFKVCKRNLKKIIYNKIDMRIDSFVKEFMIPLFQTSLSEIIPNLTENLDLGPSQIFNHVGYNAASSSQTTTTSQNFSGSAFNSENVDLEFDFSGNYFSPLNTDYLPNHVSLSPQPQVPDSDEPYPRVATAWASSNTTSFSPVINTEENSVGAENNVTTAFDLPRAASPFTGDFELSSASSLPAYLPNTTENLISSTNNPATSDANSFVPSGFTSQITPQSPLMFWPQEEATSHNISLFPFFPDSNDL